VRPVAAPGELGVEPVLLVARRVLAVVPAGEHTAPTGVLVRVVLVVLGQVLGAAEGPTPEVGAVVELVQVIEVVAVVLVGGDHAEVGLQLLQRAHTSALVTNDYRNVLWRG